MASRSKISISSRQIALFGAPLYDAFESDPDIKGRVSKEVELIKPLSTQLIKEELKDKFGQTSRGFLDRRELETHLAISRVKKSLFDEQDLMERQMRASLLRAELTEIRKMTDIAVINELRSCGVQFDLVSSGRNELDSLLAVARLDEDSDEKPSSAVAATSKAMIGEVKDDLIEELTGVAQRLRENIQDLRRRPVQTSASESVREVITKVQKKSKSTMYTKAELAASDLFESQKAERDYSLSGSRSRAGASRATGPLTRDELNGNITEAMLAANSFDSLLEWADTKSRDMLAQLLLSRGERVPKYAPHSTLASLLADSIMLEKRLALTDDAKDMGDKAEEDSGTVESETVSEVASVKRPVTTRYRAAKLERLSAYAPEKELFTKLRTLIAASFSNFFDVVSVSKRDSNNMGALFRDALTQPSFIVGLGALIAVLCAAGADITVRFARWAGGPLLAPSQTLFIAVFFCLSRKRGLLTFFGTILALRFTRLLLASAGLQNTRVNAKGAADVLQ